MDGHWLTISEYSEYRQLSVSSVRRYIKSKKVTHRKKNGKYYIFVTRENFKMKKSSVTSQKILEIKSLNDEIKRLTEENNDMKMLIKIYEQNKNIKKDNHA